jgi:hypothetical protein
MELNAQTIFAALQGTLSPLQQIRQAAEKQLEQVLLSVTGRPPNSPPNSPQPQPHARKPLSACSGNRMPVTWARYSKL